MLREWRECRDDIVEAPLSMPTVEGKVRRRTWRCATSATRWYDLTVHLGIDSDQFLVVVWECEVWDRDLLTDHMRSRYQQYGWKPTPVSGGKFAREMAMRTLTPLEVTGYTSWGGVLPGFRT